MADDGLPRVTVVLPVRNEGRAFERTLAAVAAQEYPADRMEVLVVDGMSEDETRDVVEAFSRRDPRFRLLDNPGRIVPCAMNVGIAEARGELLVRVDGHTIVASDFVRRSVEAQRKSGAECVGGRMDPVGDGTIGRVVAAATSGPFGVGDSHFHYSEEPRFTETVYMGAWPTEVLRRIGGFDEEMVRDQDDELNYRLRKSGGRVWLDPRIRSIYRPRGDLRRLWRQYFQYGFWKVRVFQKHPTMMRWRHFAPSVFVLIGTGCGIWAVLSAWGRWAFAAGLAAYLGASFLAPVREAISARERLLLPVVYFCLHAGYGAGFLAGLVRFAHRWGSRA